MNDNDGTSADPQTSAEDQALYWFIKMRGPEAKRLRSEFEVWLHEDDAHRHAYEWAAEHFDGAEMLKESRRHGAADSRSGGRWLFIGTIAAAAAAVLFLALGAHGPEPGVMPADTDIAESGQTLSAPHGRIQTYDLSDGSSVTLDTGTKVEITMTSSERHLTLASGRARIRVAEDPRPFRIEAGSGIVMAVNAVVDVGIVDEQRVAVTLISGKAEIHPALQPAVLFVPRSITPGESFFYRASQFKALPPQRAEAADTSDWPNGWVEARSIRLDALIAEANRYAPLPIVMDDPTVGAIEASGRFNVSDTDHFVEHLADVFDLEVERRPDGIHLRRK